MANIYVAGKGLVRAKRVMAVLRDGGYKIIYDWATNYNEDNPQQRANEELKAVRAADALVYLWEMDQESARYEAGMAMGLGKLIIVSGKSDPFFFQLSNVYCVDSDEQIVPMLDKLLQ